MGDRNRERESREAQKMDALAELTTYFRLCEKLGKDKNYRETLAWHDKTSGLEFIEDNYEIREALKKLYDADPDNFKANVTKAVDDSGAGNGMRTLAMDWVVGRLKFEREGGINPPKIN